MYGECKIIDDITEDRLRKVYFSCDKKELIRKIRESDAYVNFSQFGQQTTIMLCNNDFLQSVDVIEDLPPGVELSLEDFFTGGDDSDDKKEYITSVVMYPYIPHEDLAKKTGRDYIKEMDDCIEYIKTLSQEM